MMLVRKGGDEMNLNWRVTFRRSFGAPYEAAFVTAKTLEEAMRKLGSPYSVRRVSLLCEGRKANGMPCTRTVTDTQVGERPLCRGHKEESR